ncbi:MAG: Uma2 family endonuclease, partial [Chloroflexaceae bacterium]|nr:Uma2 family endonuclease [Chloroflexaceae bacterium]
KLRAYRRNGVQEYVVWQVYDQRLDWFELRDQNYEPLLPDADGISRSRVFPGLWLNVQALLADDRAALLAAIQQGMASPDHAAFVARLTQP